MPKLMVVDDDLDLLVILRHALSGKGYLVVTLADGSKVIDFIDSENPDAIILDINMGEWDGREICVQIRTFPKYNHIPIVLYSALPLDEISLKKCKADLFIQKPLASSLFLHQLAGLKLVRN